MPKVSVLMPVYNTKEHYLREAVESILNQEFNDFEFVIINDGSTEDVESVICSYKDSRIKYFKNDENKGLIFTLNYGLTLCEGKFIARMDSDDISLPQRLETQIDFMENNPEIGILGSHMDFIPSDMPLNLPLNNDEIEKYLLFIGCALAHPTVMMRKNVLSDCNAKYNPNDKYAEDYGLWLSLIGKTKFANLKEPLLNYRKHEGQVSVMHVKTQSQTALGLRVKYQKEKLGIDTNGEILRVWEKIFNKEQLNLAEFKQLAKHICFEFDSLQELKYSYVNNFRLNYRRIAWSLPKTPIFIWNGMSNPINKKLNTNLKFKKEFFDRMGRTLKD